MKLKTFSILSAVLALAVLVLGCPADVDPAPEAEIETEQDLPGQGVMTKETALKIFEYTELEDGGVRIDKFINAGALSGYLAGNARLAAAASNQPFRINRIGGRPVTRIAEKAFSPNAPGVPDISTVVLRIELPVTIVELGINLFDGVEVKITVDIPAAAVEQIKETYIEKIRVEKGADAAEAARENLELLQEVLEEVLAGSSVDIRRVEEPASPGGEVKEPEVIAEGPVPPVDTGEPDEPGDNEDPGEQPSTSPSGGGGSSNGNNTGGGSSGSTPPPGGGGSSGSTPSPAAVQLAADINKISAGSAAVNGATVTLSRELSLEGQFTVPAGVTLDVTADGAALALRDAALTVNGTVISGPDRIRPEYASEGTIKGSGTIQLKGKGHLLVVHNKLTLDGVTLAGVADNNAPLVLVYGAFVMKSGKITGNTHIETWIGTFSAGGGVEVSGGTFTMEGGTISGNTAKGAGPASGGGVYIIGGTFTMEGGEISGNTAKNSDETIAEGGGVTIRQNSTFTMKGGKISGNTAESDLGSLGGGVCITNDSVFTMEGGEISGNTIEKNGVGGGVCITADSEFTMKGGEISRNTAIGGGGVDIQQNSEFTMKGGEISRNTARGGGGVDIQQNSEFTMEGGTISENTGGGVGGNDTFTMKGGTISENTGSGVSASTFTMEGGTISGNTGSGVHIYGGGLSASVSTMKDGEISGNTGSGVNIGGGDSTFTMEGGTISRNTGSGVNIDGDVGGSTFTMKDGTISGNTGSGVNINGSGGDGHDTLRRGTFTMEGGTISENTSGGVNINGNDSTFTMKGGAISENTGSGVDINGSGGSDSTFTMEGGTISGNTGSGVNIDGNTSTFTMEGGTIYGSVEKLPVEVNPNLANSGGSVLLTWGRAKWGTGGTYTKGGVDEDGGDIIYGGGGTDDTLIAIPAN
jgi:hypothetical protein